MFTALKIVAVLIGLILLALFFPFVKEIFEVADNNGTGILYLAGTPVNNGFIQFLVPLFVVIIFVVLIIFAVRKGDNKVQ